MQEKNSNKQQELDQLLGSSPQFSQQHIARNMKLPLEMCQQGRNLLKDKKYLEASKSFAKAVMAFEFLLKNNLLTKLEIKEMFTQIMIPTYSNLSLCHLKMQSYESVVSFCNQVINHDGSHTKSKYRRGIAYQKLKKYDEAIEDFTAVKRLDPTMSIECQALIKQCKAAILKQKQKQKKMANAFIQQINDERSTFSNQLKQQIGSKNVDSEPKTIGSRIKNMLAYIKQWCQRISSRSNSTY